MADPNPPAPLPPPPPTQLTWRERLAALLARTFVRQVLLVLGLLLVVYLISRYSRDFGAKKATEWLNLYNATDVKANTQIFADPTPSPSPDSHTNSTQTSGTPSPTATANTNNSNNQTTTTENTSAGANTNPGAGSGTDSTQGAKPGGGGSTPPNEMKPPNAEQQKRLDEQLAGIRARRNHHGVVMAFFFKAYYMAISVVLFSGLIAALALFFIAQNGWSGTNPYVKTVFLVMTAVTAYYGLFPSVFQQQQNISDNKTLFLAYKGLENEVTSYPLTLTDISGGAKTPTQFITYVDSKMNTLGNIAIGFDYTKISYTGAFELNKPGKPGNTNTGNDNAQTKEK
ncbi:MAG: hypothetical protein ABR577_16010 [Pyrinomonadaceae bacterium]